MNIEYMYIYEDAYITTKLALYTKYASIKLQCIQLQYTDSLTLGYLKTWIGLGGGILTPSKSHV